MELKFSGNRIIIDKELNALDEFVLKFTSILNECDIKYVIVSGYVSILFGRSRSSEDVDLIVEKLDYKRFSRFWSEISRKFECIITSNLEDAYNQYLLANLSVRFSEKGKFIPNIEFKFPKNELDEWTLQERKEVSLNNHRIFISPLELQIPFKLYLGSEKDIEDAAHLYSIFKDELDLNLLREFTRKLKIIDSANKYLK
jgi:hypothetical protein